MQRSAPEEHGRLPSQALHHLKSARPVFFPPSSGSTPASALGHLAFAADPAGSVLPLPLPVHHPLPPALLPDRQESGWGVLVPLKLLIYQPHATELLDQFTLD